MKATRNLGLSVWAVLAILFTGGVVTAYMADNASGKKQRDGNGNMTGTPCAEGGRGGMLKGGLGNMTGMRGGFAKIDPTTLGLSANATRDEIRTAMEAKMNVTLAQIDAAIASGDYNAWKTAVEQTVGGTGLTAKITEANFSKYAEMQGYLTKARDLAKELGLQDKGMGRVRGMGFGNRGGKDLPENGQAD